MCRAELDGGLCRLGSRYGGLGGRWCPERVIGLGLGLGLVVLDDGIGLGRLQGGGTEEGSCRLRVDLGGLGGHWGLRWTAGRWRCNLGLVVVLECDRD